MKTIKRRIFYFFRKHYKLYSTIVLALGIALGCMYEGKDGNGHYFNIIGHTFYIGWIQ